MSDLRVTTHAIGEETFTTDALGEEATTNYYGEETSTTDAIGEEGPYDPVEQQQVQNPFGAY